MSNEQGYEAEISPEEEEANYAEQAQWEAEARAQMEGTIQEQIDRDYHESQMDEQAQKEYDQQTYDLIEQLREVYQKQRIEEEKQRS
jgi:hypothetical protein